MRVSGRFEQVIRECAIGIVMMVGITSGVIAIMIAYKLLGFGS